mgnify:CR=1 FL=1|tara:strand:+ start:2709 stop:3065 length:357 start_codon:yes stop_codon:yes gene_type:complete
MVNDSVSQILNEDMDIITELFKSELDNLSIDTIVDLIPHLIKRVETYKQLSGIEKKSMVLEILLLFIDRTDGFGDDTIIDPILKSIAPAIIDTLIKVDKKNIVLKKKGPCLLFKLCCK